MPLFSVIVTAYNLEKYIGECLQSLVIQDFNDFEVIVVDNGSTDQSIAICQNYADKYPERIRLIKLELPSIMHRAHSVGINAACGTYLHIMDGDDYVRKGYLREAAEIVRKQLPDVIVGRFSSFTEGNALPIRDAELDRSRIDFCNADDVIRYIRLMPAYHLAFWRYIFKRSLVSNVQLFNSYFEENKELPILDALITYRILLSASSYSLMEQPFYFYRHRVDSVSAPSDKQTLWHIQSFSEFLMLLNEYKLVGEKRKFIISKLRQELKLSLGQSDLWNRESLIKVVHFLLKAKVAFSQIMDTEMPKKLNHLAEWVQSNDLIDEEIVHTYFLNQQDEIVRKVMNKHAREIFVFPSGQFGRDIQRLLIRAGHNKVCFLDNNPDMEGRIIQGSKCYMLDDSIKEKFESPHKMLILISTIYEELDQKLYKQCLKMGIPEESLMICWP